MELLSVIAIILSIIAIVRSNSALAQVTLLQSREKNLERAIVKQQAEKQSVSQAATVHVDVASKKIEDVATARHSEEQKKEVEDDMPSAFILWLKEDWLLKLGGVLVIMGVLFFLSLAYTAVGPQGKIAMGYIFGIILMVGGFKYAKSQIVGGSAIHLVGALVVIITTYLAYQPGYGLITAIPAMMLMFVTAVCIALTSYTYNRAPLAHVGLVTAAVIPVLVSTGSNNFTGLLLYLAVVVLGVMWLAFITNWRTLILLALCVLVGYSSLYITGGMGSESMTALQAVLVASFGVIFYLTSLFSITRSQGATSSVDGIVALLNAGFALMWVIGEGPKEFVSIFVALIGFVYAAGFFLVYKITNVYASFTIYGSVAVGMLTTAIMLELDGKAETTALLLIGAAVTVFTYYLSNNEQLTKVVSFFNVLPGMYVLVSVGRVGSAIYRRGYSSNVFAEVWADLAIIMLAMGIYYFLYWYFDGKSKDMEYISLWAANCTLIILVWELTHLMFSDGLGTVAAITVYTLVGLVILFKASQENNVTKGKLSRIWLGLVAAHVILWDAWQVGDATLGVFICVVVGILLLSSAFIIKKVTETR